jgi:D-alanyl-D-alanine endopeptidase (penicillin-binding protein 7)
VDVLLNWLWQGGVIALATAGILRVIPDSRTQARYCAVWAACTALLVLPAIPLLWVASASTDGGTPSTGAPLVAMPSRWWTSATTALGLWAIWAVPYAGRIGAAVLVLRHAKKQAREFPADLEARLRHWTRLRTTGRRARLLLSHRVQTAALLGGGMPAIAVAPALVDQLNDADLDRVLIHEWAHLQRRDDVAQIGELIVGVIVGWHPAVWWLKRRLHLEREVACDELTVAVTGSAKAYAACLTTLAALPPARARWVPALAAVSSASLRHRVIRIVAARRLPSARAWRSASIAAAVTIGALALLVGRLQVVETVLASPVALQAALMDRTLAVVSHVPIISPANEEDVLPRHGRPAARSWPAPSRAGAEEDRYAAVVQMTDSASEPLGAEPPLIPVVIELPRAVAFDTSAEAPMSPAATAIEPRHIPIWEVAVDAGRAVGAGSEQAAVAAAGVFTRFGKKVARSF